MTVGVGLCLGNQLILCSDRQITRQGYDKYYEEKLFSTGKDDCYWIAMTAGGEPNLYKEIWQKATSKEFQRPRTEAIQEAFEGVLNEMGRLYTDLPVELLIGIAVDEDIRLLHFKGKGLHEISDYAFVGVGDSSLLRYLAEGLYQPGGEGILLGIYLVMCAKTYTDCCGGPTDLLVLRPGPQAYRADPSVIQQVEEQLDENEIKALPLLLMVSWPGPIEPTRL